MSKEEVEWWNKFHSMLDIAMANFYSETKQLLFQNPQGFEQFMEFVNKKRGYKVE